MKILFERYLKNSNSKAMKPVTVKRRQTRTIVTFNWMCTSLLIKHTLYVKLVELAIGKLSFLFPSLLCLNAFWKSFTFFFQIFSPLNWTHRKQSSRIQFFWQSQMTTLVANNSMRLTDRYEMELKKKSLLNRHLKH